MFLILYIISFLAYCRGSDLFPIEIINEISTDLLLTTRYDLSRTCTSFQNIFDHSQLTPLSRTTKRDLIFFISSGAETVVDVLLPTSHAPYNLNWKLLGDFPLVHAIKAYFHSGATMWMIEMVCERGSVISGKLADDVWKEIHAYQKRYPEECRVIKQYLLHRGLVHSAPANIK